MKKQLLLTVIFALAMMCGAQTPWNGTVADAYDGGDGSAENPYQIATAEQLAFLAYQTNNGDGGDTYYILTNDIDLNGSGGQIWNPIGTVKSDWTNPINPVIGPSFPFRGVFNGNNHIVSDLYVFDEDVLGLFGCIQNAEVKNVTIDGVLSQGGYVGFVVGLSVNSDISGCTTNGTIQALGNKVGGIVGNFIAENIANDTVFIKDCTNNANIHNGVFNLGGIAGYTTMDNGNVVVKNCENNGDIGDTSNTSFAGGIVGQGDYIIRDCHNYGKITAQSCAGGMVGQGGSLCLIQGCINHETGEIKGEVAGGIIGTAIYTNISCCGNHAVITGVPAQQYSSAIMVGGIAGADGSFSNCYNLGELRGDSLFHEHAQMGGITGTCPGNYLYNVYNAGPIIIPEHADNTSIYGIITPAVLSDTVDVRNCYWHGNYSMYPCTYYAPNPSLHSLPNSCSFNQGATATSWVLNDPQYGTTDLLEALNAGAMNQCVWAEDTEGVNSGYPIPIPIYYDGIEEISDNDVKLATAFPNPGHNNLNIKTDLQNAEIMVYDIMGKMIFNHEIVSDITTINSENWASGMYIWKVIANGKEAESGKWIKK